MKKIIGRAIFIYFILATLTSCSAGGSALSAAGASIRLLGPTWGRDRYQAVVYPAAPPQPIAISASQYKSQETRR
ncbi:MAG: hypothetical protein GXP59_04485 [Deltaproteobacteria bacterium]|nr:hypothetical protein [Deltaproteobacteria bacterium]